jgi:hypothetical protein
MNPPALPQNQDDLLRLAADLAPSGILVADSSGTILIVNREVERLFGYDRSELVGRPVEMLVPERFRDGHAALRSGYQKKSATRAMGAGRVLHGRRRDGSEVPLEIGLNPVMTATGPVVFASLVDISARLDLERQVRQAQKLEAVGTMASGIAHDFNNILFAISGHTELAAAHLDPRSPARADMEQVTRASERGRLLVQRLLAFSRRGEVERAPLALDRVVREALDLLRASLPSTIEIRADFDAHTPAVLSDPTQVHQIVMNLATNAAHAMPEGGRLEVTLAPFLVTGVFAAAHPGLRPGPHARLRVADTGTGIAPEVLEHVLEPFFTTKPPGAGSGLGLSVIHGIVRDHDGAIEITSAPGHGTMVDILMPAAGAAAAGAVGGPAVPAVPAEAKKPHILLVEDEEPLAAMERRLMEALGYAVTVHTSSLAALEDFRARPHAFDLLVTDNTMPHMTGLALAGELQRIRPDLRVLMISGLADVSDPEEMRRRGIHAMLRKPHTGRELESAIAALLAR